MKTVLYCQNSKSNKFWEIELAELSLNIRYGKIDSVGKVTEKKYSSIAEATSEYKKLIKDKIKNGYCEELKEKKIINWPTQKMDNEIFWELLELLNWKKQGDDDLVLKPAIAALSKMENDEIYKFDELLAEKLHAIDTKKHADAAYGKDKEFSADDFLYVRCVAVINGPDYYNDVLLHKENLDKDTEFEAILSLAQYSYELKTGKDYEYSTKISYESCTNPEGWKM